jgi:hypothetical protein
MDPESVEGRLAAILSADGVGSSRAVSRGREMVRTESRVWEPGG